MTPQSFKVERNEDGTVNFDFYRAQARKEREVARATIFAKMLRWMSGKRGRQPAKGRPSIASLSY